MYALLTSSNSLKVTKVDRNMSKSGQTVSKK